MKAAVLQQSLHDLPLEAMREAIESISSSAPPSPALP